MFEQAEFAEQGKGVASGVAHGCSPAGKCPGAQVCGALKIGEAGDKKFAAPNGPVGAGARAIEGDTQNARIGHKPPCGDGLGHHAHDVRMMVLDFDKWQVLFPRLLTRPLAR